MTAHELSKRGAKVVMLCRDLEKADEAADDIRKDTGNVVSVVHLDLSSLESVRKCAEELHYNEDRIDILVNNAGKISNFSLSRAYFLSILKKLKVCRKNTQGTFWTKNSREWSQLRILAKKLKEN